MNGVQTRLKCKPNVKRCKRFVFAAHSPLLHPNTLKTKAIIHFQTDHILTRFVFPPLYAALDEKKQNEALANIVALDDIDTERTDAEFFAYLESKKIKTTAKLIKDCRTFFGEVSETAPEVHVIPLDDNSDLVADTNLRDYESIPFKTDIQEYFQNEVLRFTPDAWMDREKDKIGCEFPISKLFYEYQPLRSVEDILADIRALEEDEEQELSSLLND